ncbi:unnamed protein product [Parajaminaea phylloscopi]
MSEAIKYPSTNSSEYADLPYHPHHRGYSNDDIYRHHFLPPPIQPASHYSEPPIVSPPQSSSQWSTLPSPYSAQHMHYPPPTSGNFLDHPTPGWASYPDPRWSNRSHRSPRSGSPSGAANMSARPSVHSRAVGADHPSAAHLATAPPGAHPQAYAPPPLPSYRPGAAEFPFASHSMSIPSASSSEHAPLIRKSSASSDHRQSKAPSRKRPAANPSAVLGTVADSDRPRQARNLACAFCRGRKLRCVIDDGGSQCRQCHRRDLECILPNTALDAEETMPKAKKRRSQGGSSDLSGSGSSTDQPPRAGTALDKSAQSAVGTIAEITQLRPANSLVTPSVASLLSHDPLTSFAEPRHDQLHSDATSSEDAFKVSLSLHPHSVPDMSIYGSSIMDSSHDPVKSEETNEPALALTRFDPASAPLRVLGGLPAEMPAWGVDWWDSTLALFGPRNQALKMALMLLDRFVKTNSSLTGLFHTPSFVSEVRRAEKRKSVQPALVLSALAAGLCDLNLARVEPYTANVAAADVGAQKLVRSLRQMAYQYIDSSLASPQGPTVGLAHAAIVMALTEGSFDAKCRLLGIAEFVMRVLKLPESPGVKAIGPESLSRGALMVYEAPTVQPSPEADVRLELVTRLCKAHVSIAVRSALIKPDEDDPGFELPDFVTDIRAFGYWEPSALSGVLPTSYHASTHFARAASLTSKTFARVVRLPPTASRFLEEGSPSEEILRPLRDLEEIEDVFLWLQKLDSAHSTAIFPLNSQNLLVKLHVYTRMLLWRKTAFWTLREDMLDCSRPVGGSDGLHGSEPADGAMLPSFRRWFVLLSELLGSLDADSGQHTANGTKLTTTIVELDSAVRHVRVALQMLGVVPRYPASARKLLCNIVTTLQVHLQLRLAAGKSEDVPDPTALELTSLKLQVEQLRTQLSNSEAAISRADLGSDFALSVGSDLAFDRELPVSGLGWGN